MKPEKMPLLHLVALVRQPPPEEVILHPGVREKLAELMPRTSLATAWQTMREIEQEQKAAGCEALGRYRWSPWLDLAEPDPPRPATEADLAFAAHLTSPSVVIHERLREELAEYLARGPLGPAIWRMREIVWAATTPPVAWGGKIEPIAALDAWREAGVLVDELLALPVPLQAAAEERYHRSLLVHQLLYRERLLRFQDPPRCLELTRVATAVAKAIMHRAGSDWHRFGGLVALALAAQANAHRIVGQTVDAGEVVAAVPAYIRGETDPVMRWECSFLTGTVFTCLRWTDRARQALDATIGMAREMADGHRLAIALVSRSFLDCVAGELSRESLFRVREAVELADPNRDPWLRGIALLNLAWYQADLQFFDEAESSWRRVEPFADENQELKRQGVLGYIHLKRGRWGPAIEILGPCAEGLLAAGHGDGAYYQLHLALALLGAGRAEEANRTSLEAARFFEAARVQTISIQAANVAAAAERQMITAAKITDLIRSIEAAPEARGRVAQLTRRGELRCRNQAD